MTGCTRFISPRFKHWRRMIKRNLHTCDRMKSLPIGSQDRNGALADPQTAATRDRPAILLTTSGKPRAADLLRGRRQHVKGLNTRVDRRDPRARDSKTRRIKLIWQLARLANAMSGPETGGLSPRSKRRTIANLCTPPADPCPILLADPRRRTDYSRCWHTDAAAVVRHGAAYAIPAVLEQVRQHKTTPIFHNTRAKPRFSSQPLGLPTKTACPCRYHHGLLSVSTERVRSRMVRGDLRDCLHGSLDLGSTGGRRRSCDPDSVPPKNVKLSPCNASGGAPTQLQNAPSKAAVPGEPFRSR